MSRMGLTAGLLHMIFHAVTKITLFFCAGAMLHHNRLEYVYDLEGLAKRMPCTCAVFAIFSVALVGIPPFGAFLSKWLTAAAAAANGGVAGHLGTASLIVSAVLAMLYTQSVVVRLFFPLRTAKPQPAEMHEADRLMTGTLMFLTLLLIALSLCSRMIETWIGGLV